MPALGASHEPMKLFQSWKKEAKNKYKKGCSAAIRKNDKALHVLDLERSPRFRLDVLAFHERGRGAAGLCICLSMSAERPWGVSAETVGTLPQPLSTFGNLN